MKRSTKRRTKKAKYEETPNDIKPENIVDLIFFANFKRNLIKEKNTKIF